MGKVKRMTLDQLRAKIQWEGSFEQVLDYGISHEEVPKELAKSWEEMEKLYADYKEKVDEIEFHLNMDEQ